MDHILGLDLGRMNDRTALAVVKRSLMLHKTGAPLRDHRARLIFRFNVSQAKVYPLGTSYPKILEHIRDVVLAGGRFGANPHLVVDATGVGGAVIDMLLTEMLPARIVPLTITGGDTIRRGVWPGGRAIAFWVAKGQLVSATQVALQSRRLKVSDIPHAAGAPDAAKILRDELKNFTVKVSKAANELYTHREGTHDDLLLATAMSVFLGGRVEWVPYEQTARSTDEAATLEAEHKARTEAIAIEKGRILKAMHDAAAEADRKRQANAFDPSWDPTFFPR